MKSPWLSHSREEVELEALQTDIMRFMAILGLCLTAIFSLVQGAAQERAGAEQSVGVNETAESAAIEQADVETVAREQTPAGLLTTEQPGKGQTVEPLQPVPKRTAPIAQSTAVIGFTLEFASVHALEMLLEAGKVQLYARHGEQFWLLDTDGGAVPAQTPSSYYQMHTGTVPRRLRSAVPGNGVGEAIAWGVTLPEEATVQIQRLTTGRKGGSLLIGYDAVVVLEDASGSSGP